MNTLTADPIVNAEESLDSCAAFQTQEPLDIPVKERHLDQGHPWFEQSSPLALAINELLNDGQYALCDYQTLWIKGGSRVPFYRLEPRLVAWLENYLLAWDNPARTRPGSIKIRLQDGKAELI